MPSFTPTAPAGIVGASPTKPSAAPSLSTYCGPFGGAVQVMGVPPLAAMAWSIAAWTFASVPLVVSPPILLGDDPRTGESCEVRRVLRCPPLGEGVAAVDDEAD